MPGIGSSLKSASNIITEAVVKPTADTLKVAAKEGIVEPIIGTPTTSSSASQPADTTSKYNPKQRQNVVNFLNAMAAQDKQSREKQREAAENQKQVAEEQKKQTEIRQIETIKKNRQIQTNRAVFDSQRKTEIRKGGA